MTPADTARVLALVQAFDNRNVDELIVGAWHTVLHDLTFEDCTAAVREHYARSDSWLMPSAVRDSVKRLRAERLNRTIDPIPNVDPDRPLEFAAAVREQRRAIADGHDPAPDRLRLVGTRGMPDGFADTFRTVRDEHRPAQLEHTPAAPDPREAEAREEIRRLYQTGGDDMGEGSPS